MPRAGIIDRAHQLGLALLASCLATLCLGGNSRALAGGGPENVLLVVNSRSWASQTIANYYIQLRGIPAQNVVYLDWSERLFDAIPIDTFRAKILLPVLQAIDRQGLSNQIDYIIYSSDFPTAVNIQTDAKDQKLPQQLTGIASLSSLTYYFQFVALKNIGYLQLGPEPYSNVYYRRPSGEKREVSTLGFRSWYGWNIDGNPLEAGGQRYFLSTLLGITGGQGNSVSEVIAYLKAARSADGTNPRGTIYFMDNPDPRSSGRKTPANAPEQPSFADAVAVLKRLGVAAEITSGVMPTAKPDVQGLVMGSDKFDWAESKSTIRPGAICEHLTSFGGMFDDFNRQTPLTEFLRYGAAGASGTVVEPYLILQKFPSPFVHVHYARGASLAEAFYQSVAGPFQLLIVGDALCQPWARIPQVTVSGLTPDTEIKGLLQLQPAAKVPGGGTVQRYILCIDGIAMTGCFPGETLSLDTSKFLDGHHVLSVIAIENSRVESQGRWTAPVVFNNAGVTCTLTAEPSERRIVAGTPLKLTVAAPGATKVAVLQNTRVLGTIDGAQGTIDVKTDEVGFGPVRFRAAVLAAEGDGERAISAPIEFDVRPAASLEPMPPTARTKPGLLLTRADGTTTSVTDTTRHSWLNAAGVKPQEDYKITGYVDAPIDDVYQFHIAHFGTAEISVDKKVIYQGNDPSSWPTHYVPVALKPGKHLVEIKGHATLVAQMDLRFGVRGAQRAGEKNFEHE